MRSSNLKSDALLLLTATIWGFAFVAQRVGMDHVGPFTYSATRFALGIAVLLPFLWYQRRQAAYGGPKLKGNMRTYLIGGSLSGLALFGGVSFQQVGLVYTTAGNAGFITGLYVVIVPIMGLVLHQHTHAGTWTGAALAAVGLYLLSVTEALTIQLGDLLVLLGAVIWAAHVHILGRFAPRTDPLVLAIFQFVVCTVFSFAVALAAETIRWTDLVQAALPIFYGGALSVGVAYTLQVVAQRHAHPAHAAILLSLEAVFAAIGGWLLLHEVLSLRGLIGCALMLSGMLLSQLYGILKPSPAA